MPLLPGSSKEVIAENIRSEVGAGRPQSQAIAVAYEKAGKGKKKLKKKKSLVGKKPFIAR